MRRLLAGGIASVVQMTTPLAHWALIFIGGGIGAALRFGLGSWIFSRAPEAFPWGTFSVNALGCFAIGIAVVLADEHAWLTSPARQFAIVGVLGGFTTFSTFGIETFALLADGRAAAAFGYAAGSVVIGLAAVAAGVLLARALG